MSALQVALPDDFVVLAAADAALVDVVDVSPELRVWWDGVRAEQAQAGADLVALGLREVDGVAAAVSLAVKVTALPDQPPGVAAQALRAVALTRTSTAGQVSVLDLPVGEAVASADVVAAPDGTPAAQVVLHLLAPAVGQLVSLTLLSPSAAHLPALAALSAAVAAGVRPEPEDDDAPAAR